MLLDNNYNIDTASTKWTTEWIRNN